MGTAKIAIVAIGEVPTVNRPHRAQRSATGWHCAPVPRPHPNCRMMDTFRKKPEDLVAKQKQANVASDEKH